MIDIKDLQVEFMVKVRFNSALREETVEKTNKVL